MAEEVGGHVKGPNAWRQAFAAMALAVALGGALWASEELSGNGSGPPPATCSDEDAGKAAGRVTGKQLCEALHRPDLAALLGTPAETAKTASGGDSSFKPAGGKEIATPSAQVEFDTYTVTLSATYDGLPVAGSHTLLGNDAEQRKVLGRPAVLYSDRTISISFRLDGSDSETGPGVPARALTVAQDAKDRGGSLDVTLWRADGGVPDDAVLLRVAEKVLPTVPGWTAGR
jgi:hypothetical protein